MSINRRRRRNRLKRHRRRDAAVDRRALADLTALVMVYGDRVRYRQWAGEEWAIHPETYHLIPTKSLFSRNGTVKGRQRPR